MGGKKKNPSTRLPFLRLSTFPSAILVLPYNPHLGKHFARIFHDPFSPLYFSPPFNMRATQARNAIKLSRSRERMA